MTTPMTPSDELASHLADIKLQATEREYELLQALKSQGKEINRLRAAASPAVLAEVDEGDPVRTPSVRYEFSGATPVTVGGDPDDDDGEDDPAVQEWLKGNDMFAEGNYNVGLEHFTSAANMLLSERERLLDEIDAERRAKEICDSMVNRLTELLQIEGATSEDDAFVKRVNLDAVVGRVESLMRDASEARKEADRKGESVKSALEKIEAVTKMHASLEGKHDRQRKTFEKRLARVKALCATEKEK